MDTHPGEKVLVFTQFADTVQYLAGQLNAAGVERLAAVTGSSADPTQLAWRFSPNANGKRDQVSPDAGAARLISTDVLSEGQNLQDCAIVVNYDLPWAIIRLIQRAGRVDRIGQQAQNILCYSFLPAEGIERLIRLRARVRTRLNENAEVVGTDEAFFEDEDTRAVHDLYNEQAGILDGDDDAEVDLASYAYQIWNNATDGKPALKKAIEEMPAVVHSSKANQIAPPRPDGALVYLRTAHDNDALVWLDRDGSSVTESQFDILRAAHCRPDTPALPRHQTHHALVRQAAQSVASHERQVGGQLGRPSGARFRSYDRLKNYAESVRGTIFDSDPLRRASRRHLPPSPAPVRDRYLEPPVAQRHRRRGPRRPRHRNARGRPPLHRSRRTGAPRTPNHLFTWPHRAGGKLTMPTPLDRAKVKQHLDNFDLLDLFTQELGWDHGGSDTEVTVKDRAYPLQAIAHKRGMVAYRYLAQPGADFPDHPTRQQIERKVAKEVREHIIIFAAHDRSAQYWLWVKREPGRPDRPRTHIYRSDQSGEPLIQKLERIVFTLEDEADLSIVDVTGHVLAAFDVEKVTRKFYDRFKKEHQDFLGFIEGINNLADREWYASLMLNRMMFIYFIQKRGFLDNDPDYLRDRLQTVRQQHGAGRFAGFYRLFLLKLFHEGLGQPEAERDPELIALLGQVPYLNGGLFDVHDLERDYPDIDIPDEAFEQIFRLLRRLPVASRRPPPAR